MAAFTHFWITGGGPLAVIDNTTVRYYLDGEAAASIAFKPPLAAGVGFDDDTVWGQALASHASGQSAWSIKYKIPFRRSARVTLQLPGAATASCQAFVIVRGCENLPVQVGPVTLPSTARLQLQKIENEVFQPLEWVPIADVPSGDGLLFMHTLQAASATNNFWEGCYHLYTPHDQPFPGTVMSTGTEDFFDSSYGFAAGPFRFPVSGCTHRDSSKGMKLSAYRFFTEDIVAFSGGMRFVWRVGDLINEKSHPESPKCWIDKKGPGDQVVGNPQPTTITSYAWIYVW